MPADERLPGGPCTPAPERPARVIDRLPHPGIDHDKGSDADIPGRKRGTCSSAPPMTNHRHGESDYRFLDAGTRLGYAMSMLTTADSPRARDDGSILRLRCPPRRSALLASAWQGHKRRTAMAASQWEECTTAESALHQLEGRQYAKQPFRVIGFSDEPQTGIARE